MALLKRLEINRYKILSKIGEGSYGEIFRATDLPSGREVAMKVVLFSNLQSKLVYEREIFFSSHLDHPNILPLLHHYVIDGEFGVMVMEKMDIDLMDFILKETPSSSSPPGLLSMKELQWIYNEVCKGVRYLHGNNIAHCDIKPENVLLKLENGKVKKVVLCDFGFALDWKKEKTPSPNFGTKEYLPPEVTSTSSSSSISYEMNMEKVDLWCLAVVLFVLITGLFPFVNVENTSFALDYKNMRSMIYANRMMDILEDGFEEYIEEYHDEWARFFTAIFNDVPSLRPSISNWSQYSFLSLPYNDKMNISPVEYNYNSLHVRSRNNDRYLVKTSIKREKHFTPLSTPAAPPPSSTKFSFAKLFCFRN